MSTRQGVALSPASAPPIPIPWKTILGAWAIYWLLNTVQQQAAWYAGRGYFLPFWISLVLQYPLAACWALATPVILRLGRRFPLSRGRWPASATVHLVLSLAFVFALLVLYTWHSQNVIPVRMWATPFFHRVIQGFTVWALSDALLYWIVLVIGYAVEESRRSREREVAASQLETQLAQADLHALRMQLQPHFLFNALHTVGSLVRTGEREDAVKVVARLGDLLRRLLDVADREEVPLREELAFITSYLEIEQARFRDRLTVTISADEDVMDARVPHLVLQPLVENAIRHGLAPRSAPGRLLVGARRVNDRLHLTVRDDGAGMDASARPGVGLSNTHARLARLYGDDYDLDVHNAAEGGLEARIVVPFRLASEPVGVAVGVSA
jgi:signal transduction histidine kinase